MRRARYGIILQNLPALSLIDTAMIRVTASTYYLAE
jgi:energy-converting hydrogenase Eha subunit C